MKLVTTLRFERSTKGTHLYLNTDPQTPIRNIYITRDAIPDVPPKQIKVEVSDE